MLTMCFLYGRYTKNSLYFLAVQFYTGCGIYAVIPINRKARISVNLKQHICDMQFNAVAVTLKS